MIKVQTVKPFSTVSSNSGSFSNDVNAARYYFFKTYQYSNVLQRFPVNQNDDYLYFYQIQKFNVKKAIVTIKDETKRVTVSVGGTVLKVYRFRKENIVSSKQHNRHFEVTLKF